MNLNHPKPPLIVVVGSGGVGKTTLAASMGLVSAAAGLDSLVMTFDPSLRLKDALGVGPEAKDQAVDVAIGDSPGRLAASLLDARRTFDRLVTREAPDAASRQRILENPYYGNLAGNLGGMLEYMAVERLYEVAKEGSYDRIILDTPPTHQAIDFLEAPRRIIDFLDSGALRIALKPWFDRDGSLRSASGLGFVTRRLESWLDRLVGMQLLRDMSEFFRAFEPLFLGFRKRAEEVERLLASPDTLFVLVTGPGKDRIPDTLFFARRLQEAGYHLGPIVVNRIHPRVGRPGDEAIPGRDLFRWLGQKHQEGVRELQALLGARHQLVPLPLAPGEPTDLDALMAVGRQLEAALEESAPGR